MGGGRGLSLTPTAADDAVGILGSMTEPIEEIREALERGDHPTAHDLARSALARTPDDPWILAELARAMAGMTGGASGMPLLERARTLVADDAEATVEIGMQLAQLASNEGDLEGALAILDPLSSKVSGERARKLRTRRIQALIGLGRLEEARAAVGEALRTGLPGDRVQCLLAEVEAADGDHGRARGRLEPIVGNQSANPRTRSYLAFLLARICDRLGDYDAAFEHATLGNRLAEVEFDPVAFEAETDAIVERFQRSADLPRVEGDSGERTVLVVGMPRSGTTLLEQIVSAHPAGAGLGERGELGMFLRLLEHRTGRPHPACLLRARTEDLEEFATGYRAMERRLAPDARRVTNKALGLDRILGFASMVLPRSRAIVIRREPLDNLLSIYLNPLAAWQFPWACSLEGVVVARRRFDRLTRHWIETLDLAILEADYETLASRPTEEIPSILKFLDLPFDQSAIDFHRSGRTVMTPSRDQVRRPMNREGIERWRRYERHLGPLLAAFPPTSD